METETPPNFIGATVFWLYILAALALTGVVLQALYRLHASRTSQQPGPQRQIWLFATLALVSFSTLSFNMLHVLIQSFQLWSNQQYPAQYFGYPQAIWQWSIASSLFRDFGEAIVANPARFLWVQSALLATLSICFYMGIEGRRRGIPKLWAFFGLSQILPISFAQNMFYLANLLSESPPRTKHVPKFWSVANVAAYCSTLANAQTTAGTKYLIPTILAARVVLLTPLFLASEEDGYTPMDREAADAWLTGEGLQSIITLVSLLVTGLKVVQTVQEGWSGDKILSALFSHPAVASLGCDFLLSFVSYMAWTSVGSAKPVKVNAPHKASKNRG